MNAIADSRVQEANRALATLKDERAKMAAIYGDSIAGRIQLQAYDRTIQSAEQRIREMAGYE